MQLINGECISEMNKLIADGIKVDAVICDPPYGTTACKWDSVIPFEPMWDCLNKLIKDNGAIVLFGSQPFTSSLIMSNPKMFKYEWIYQKRVGSNFAQAKRQPLKEHENILVFYKEQPTYNPIKEERKGSGLNRLKSGYKSNSITGEFNNFIKSNRTNVEYTELKYPSSVQEFNNREKGMGLHPTQKPVALMEYLVKTYTNEGETVLDFTMGSGTTGVACKKLKREFIGIELDENYFNIAKDRIENYKGDIRRSLI